MVDETYNSESGRGQLMERSTIVQAGENTLEAIYLRGDAKPPVLVVPGIHISGGNMEGAVSNELAYTSSYNGHASLRFAWHGQGASEGELPKEGESLESLQVDLEHTVQHLLDCEDCETVALVALRDGALPALTFAKANPEKVALVALVDPPDEAADQIGEQPTFVFFPGEEVIPKAFHGFEKCSVARIPKADRAFRRNLSLLGQSVANLLSRPR